MEDVAELLGNLLPKGRVRPKLPWSPEERARRTLLSFLSPDQKKTFTEEGYFIVKGIDGFEYRLCTTEAAERICLPLFKNIWNGVPDYAKHYRLHRLRGAKIDAWPVYSRKEKRGAYQHYAPSEITRYKIMPEADTLLALKLLLETTPHRAMVGCSVTVSST